MRLAIDVTDQRARADYLRLDDGVRGDAGMLTSKAPFFWPYGTSLARLRRA